MTTAEAQVEVVERDPVEVWFRAVADEPEAISRCWDKVGKLDKSVCYLESYGAFEGGEYRVCIPHIPGVEPEALELEEGTLPGGRYACVRLHGELSTLFGQIAPTFERLMERPDHDASRPGIEHYQGSDTIDLLLPIK